MWKNWYVRNAGTMDMRLPLHITSVHKRVASGIGCEEQ